MERINTCVVYKNLESPVNDNFPLEEIIEKVAKTETKSQVRQRIV